MIMAYSISNIVLIETETSEDRKLDFLGGIPLYTTLIHINDFHTPH